MMLTQSILYFLVVAGLIWGGFWLIDPTRDTFKCYCGRKIPADDWDGVCCGRAECAEAAGLVTLTEEELE